MPSMFRKKNFGIKDVSELEYEIDITDVYTSYGKEFILQGVSYKTKPGTISGIIGTSGSGKTTMLRLITGQINPLKGSAYVAGIDVKKNKEALNYVTGYVPQHDNLSLYLEFSALTNAKYYGKMYQLNKNVINARAREVLKILGFTEDLMTKPVRFLSGGERKRASIAVGMINQPRVLLLDEPTTGLDAHLRHEVLNFLKNLNHNFGTTMVIISHDLEIVDYCNHIMILENGRVSQAGNPQELVVDLPGSGYALQIEYDLITPILLRKLNQLPETEYVVRRGRNAINIFTPNPQEKISKYLELLNSWDLRPRQLSVVRTDFSDFFQVKPWNTKSESSSTPITAL